MVMVANNPEMSKRSMAIAEKNVPLEWNVGDVILDLYEVKPVNEEGKTFHSGGFGKVYKVGHKTWNIDLAVKAPHAHRFTNQTEKANFIKECQSWIELGMHPNIASCFYVRELSGVPRIFAEYVEGGSLSDWIERGLLYEGNSDIEVLKKMLDIAIQFAWGLHYAHEKGMIHQDVKPQNVMMTVNGEAKVVDFGLARAKPTGGGQSKESEAGQSIMVTSAGGYTPAYCSPEQIGGKSLTRRTDMWSWGVSVMQMFTGAITWESGVLAAQSLEVLLEHNGEDDDIPPMPGGVASLLKECFKADEKSRPHTLMDVADRLIETYQTEMNEEYPRRWEEGASDTPDTLNNHALSYIDLGEVNHAEELWNKAIKHNSQHLQSIYNRGLLLWRTGKITDEEFILQIKTVKVDPPDLWLYHYLLGMVYIEQNNAQSAIAVLEEAVNQSANDKTVLYAREKAYEGKGKWNKCLRVFQEQKHEGIIYSVALSKDEKYGLSGSGNRLHRGTDSYTMKLWELSTGKCLRTFEGHTDTVSSVNMSDDGRLALSGSWDKTLKLWDIAKNKCLRTFEGHSDLVLTAALSSDMRYAVSGSGREGHMKKSLDNTLKLWDLATGKCLRTFEGHTDAVNSLKISKDGDTILSGSWDNTLKLWELSTGRCLRTFGGHTNSVCSVAFSVDGHYALSGSKDCTLKLWDISTGDCLRTFYGHKGYVISVALSEDGRMALSAGENDFFIKLWEVSTGKSLYTVRDGNGISPVVLSAEGQFAFAGTLGGKLKLWALENQNNFANWQICKPEKSTDAIIRESQLRGFINQSRIMEVQGNYPEKVKWLKKAKSLQGCSRLKEVRDAWAMLYRELPKCSLENGWEIQNFIGHNSGVNSVALSADGTFALSGCSDKTIKLWDVMSGKCLGTFEGHQNDVNSVSISVDQRYALSASRDNTLKLWDVFSSKCLHTSDINTNNVLSAALCSDNHHVLSGGWSPLNLSDISSSMCLRTFGGLSSGVTSIAISCDERYILSGHVNGTLNLWVIATGKCLRTFEGKRFHVNSVAISPDGRYALSGYGDKFYSGYELGDCNMELWEIATGKCLRTFEGHKSWISTVAISADGRYALSGSGDKTLKLWNIATGECLLTLEGHTNGVLTATISADGRYVLSGSKDGTLKLWELDWDVELREQTDWDDGAKVYLHNFLIMHQPVVDENTLIRTGKPEWTEEEFNTLITELGYRGYGFLRPEGVKNKLEEMMK